MFSRSASHRGTPLRNDTLDLTCLVADAFLLVHIGRRNAAGHFARRQVLVAAGGAGLSLPAICGQALPMLWR